MADHPQRLPDSAAVASAGPVENDSRFTAAPVTSTSPVNSLHPRARRFSLWRVKLLLLLVAMGWGLGYVMAPAEVILLEPKDEDLVVLNGCVISACSYMATVRAQHKLEGSFWARVMLVRYKGNSAGHAYCVWETDGHIFGYDRAGGAFPIPGSLKDPSAIASSLASGLEKVMRRPMIVAQAEFIEPRTSKLYAY
jgi:hypothetical protein